MKFRETSLRNCAFPKERQKKGTIVYWVTAGEDGANITLAEKHSGCQLTPATFHCACSTQSMPVQDLGNYLEKAFAQKQFKKLVLVGSQLVIQRIRHCIPESLKPLIAMEIIEPEQEQSADQ